MSYPFSEKERNVIVTREGERLCRPEDYEMLARKRRAYEDNFIYSTRERALEVAREEVEMGLAGACVWQSGIGDWLVNGWR